MLSNLILRDATKDESARNRANHAPQLSRDLAALGFSPIGIIEARTKNQQNYDASIRGMMSAEDANMLINVVAQGECVEVMSAPDLITFGVPERSVGGPVIALETVFEDGTVIETTMRPARAPRPLGSNAMDPGIRLLSVLLLLTGRPPIWPRYDIPGAGFYVELFDTRDARQLYERHRARVREYQQRRQARPARHDSLDIYRAIRLRQSQATRNMKFWNDTLGFLAILVVVPVIFVWTFFTRPAHGAAGFLSTLAILMLVLLALLGQALLARWIAPRIPLRRTPLKILVELQRNVWGKE